MTVKNKVYTCFTSLSENVGLARIMAASFAAQIDFTLNEIEEIKVAISEAVSNSVIHGYDKSTGDIEFTMVLHEDRLEFTITDFGKGIADIDQARQPSYSSDPERMGLGFVFMESFMDELEVVSEPGKGTTVRMIKKFETCSAH